MAASSSASSSSSSLLPRLAAVALLVLLLCGAAPHCVDGARFMREEAKQVGAGHWGSAGTTGASGAGVVARVEGRRMAVVMGKAPVPPSGPSKKHD